MPDIIETTLAQDIADFIDSWGFSGDFYNLALRLFAYQYSRNSPYTHFCNSLGISPSGVGKWSEIPAAPSGAFRIADLSCSPEPPAAVFLTSGTTGNITGKRPNRGAHIMDSKALELYCRSLRAGFSQLASRCVGLPIRALLPSWAMAPESSLAFMATELAATKGSQFYWEQDGPNIPGAVQSLSKETSPVLLLTTAFALAELLESLSQPLQLPEGSFVIETGGFKGRRRAIERSELYKETVEKLGVSPLCIGSEYGMCEMASQFYDTHLSHPIAWQEQQDPIKVGPPWVRSIVIDPASGTPCPPGHPGLLRHFDLANLNSVLAIQTEDMGTATDRGFILHGRISTAVPRGCSLTIEEWCERS